MMKGNILIFNLFLLLAFLALLALPNFLTIGFLQKPQSQVAGLQTKNKNPIVIQPNLADFSDLVTFKNKSEANQRVSQEVELGLFPGQIAIYRRLFSFTNNSASNSLITVGIDSNHTIPADLKIEGLLENGKTYPPFPLGIGTNFLLARGATLFLTIKISPNNKLLLNRISVPLIFTTKFIQN